MANYPEMAKQVLKWIVAETTRTTDKLYSPEKAAEIAAIQLASTGRLTVEHVGVISLNSSNQIVGADMLGTGTVNQAPVYPREVARIALNHDAAAIILWHNHPGGHATPSNDDLQLTRELKAAMERLSIQLHDHLVIAGNEAYSISAGKTYPIASAQLGLGLM